MCKILNVARSGYYKYIKRKTTAREVENQVLMKYIQDIFIEHKSRYGSGRIRSCLRNMGMLTSKKRVTKLMRAQGLYAKGARYKYKYHKKDFVLPTRNLIDQNFNTIKKNSVWFGDITYIQTYEGTLYLSVFLDLFTRRVVGYALNEHMKDTMVIDSLEMAIKKERPNKGLIVHTDQGTQYTSHDFIQILEYNGFIRSNSNKGNPYDNALMESFFKTFKREVLPKQRYKTKKEARLEILNYLEVYYNDKRHHTSLGHMTPSEFDTLNS